MEGDPLTNIVALKDVAPDWAAMLRHGLDAANLSKEGKDVAELIEARLRTGRPLAAENWIKRQEEVIGKRLRPRKPGPTPKTPSKVRPS